MPKPKSSVKPTYSILSLQAQKTGLGDANSPRRSANSEVQTIARYTSPLHIVSSLNAAHEAATKAASCSRIDVHIAVIRFEYLSGLTMRMEVVQVTPLSVCMLPGGDEIIRRLARSQISSDLLIKVPDSSLTITFTRQQEAPQHHSAPLERPAQRARQARRCGLQKCSRAGSQRT